MESTQNTATTTASKPTPEQIQTQIEYYLSDDNIKHDKFFHEKITDQAEGYVDVSNFLNCNKVKKLNITADDITSAVKNSTLLEVKGDLIRRAGNKSLPELKLLKRKTGRNQDGDMADESHLNVSSDPVILEIKAEKEPEFKWKPIQDEFKEVNPNLNVVYLRFSGDSGHIGVLKSKSASDVEFKPELTVEGVKFTVKKCEGDELISFWKDHGSHFEMCISRNKKIQKGKDKKKRDPNALRTAIKLGDETYTDVGKIKSRVRGLLTSTIDGEKINTGDHGFLFDLLKSHKNFEGKSKDISYFTTGQPREHEYSRCFFIVRGDDSKEDFSVHKCIERIGIENNKKK